MSDDTASILKDAQAKMTKTVEVTKDEFTAIRTGRASAAMFQGITVEYYGAPTPLNQLASLQFPEARTVIVTPYDKTAMSATETALRESDLGVNPTNNGDTLRVVLPALTEERRRDYVKLARTKAEDGRVAVRNLRRTAKHSLEKLGAGAETRTAGDQHERADESRCGQRGLERDAAAQRRSEQNAAFDAELRAERARELAHARDRRERVEAAGARVTSSVSKSTAFVVVGARPGTKYDKAQALGIETVDEQEFLHRLGRSRTLH